MVYLSGSDLNEHFVAHGLMLIELKVRKKMQLCNSINVLLLGIKLTIMKSLLFLLILALICFSQNIKPTDISTDTLLNNKALIPISDSLLIDEMNFKNSDIRDVLRTIGFQYNINIWLSPK